MSKLWVQVLKIVLTLLIPIVIVLGSVRLVASEPYLAFEYSKPDFPEDPFGFVRSQRLTHAAANLQFITQNQPIADLARQDHDGAPLYNARELSHMQDVQNVFQTAWRVWLIAVALSVISVLALARRKENRPDLASALCWGGGLTAGIIVVVGLAAIVAWQGWFILFHQVFFAAGSWTFNYSDTLIRLFPEKFWYDTALTISNLSPLAGILMYWIGTRLQKSGNGEAGPHILHDYQKPSTL